MMSQVTLDNAPGASDIRISKKKQFLFSLVIFFVFLVTLEAVLRILGIPGEIEDLRNDPGLISRSDVESLSYTPGWSGYQAGALVHINSRGFRGKEFTDEKPPRTIRIAGLGDSFTFGRAVNDEDVFLVKLEELLNRVHDRPMYETLNFGRERVNTVGELKLFKDEAVIKFDPDLLVLAFTVHNDAQSFKDRGIHRKLRRAAPPLLNLVQRESFVDLTKTFRLAGVAKLGVEWAYISDVNERYYDMILSNYVDGSQSWEACNEALEGFYSVAGEKKIPLLFLIFPVYPMDANQTFSDYPEELRRVHEKLASVFAGREGVTVVDMLPALAASGLTARESMVAIDRHPNARWHDIVARSLYEAIIGMGLEPAGESSAETAGAARP